jgi:hypothetical protein
MFEGIPSPLHSSEGWDIWFWQWRTGGVVSEGVEEGVQGKEKRMGKTKNNHKNDSVDYVIETID